MICSMNRLGMSKLNNSVLCTCIREQPRVSPEATDCSPSFKGCKQSLTWKRRAPVNGSQPVPLPPLRGGRRPDLGTPKAAQSRGLFKLRGVWRILSLWRIERSISALEMHPSTYILPISSHSRRNWIPFENRLCYLLVVLACPYTKK